MFFLIQLSRLFLIMKIRRLPPLELKRDKSPEGLSTRCSSDHQGFTNTTPASCLCFVSQIVRYSDHMVAQITRQKFHGEANSVFYIKECRGGGARHLLFLFLCYLTIMFFCLFCAFVVFASNGCLIYDKFRHFHH